MDKKDFRIKEFRGQFTIQRKFKDSWWYSGRVTESWENINIYGGRISDHRFSYMLMLDDFESSKDAKKWLNELFKGAKYHEV